MTLERGAEKAKAIVSDFAENLSIKKTDLDLK